MNGGLEWLPIDEEEDRAEEAELEVLGNEDESLHPLTEVMLEHPLHDFPESKLHPPPASAAGGY